MKSDVINKEIIEFEIADKKKAVGIRQSISEVAISKIPLIMDEVVSKYLSKDDLLRIKRIEIDLGAIDSENIEEEFVERFRKQFSDEIIKYSYLHKLQVISGNKEFSSFNDVQPSRSQSAKNGNQAIEKELSPRETESVYKISAADRILLVEKGGVSSAGTDSSNTNILAKEKKMSSHFVASKDKDYPVVKSIKSKRVSSEDRIPLSKETADKKNISGNFQVSLPKKNLSEEELLPVQKISAIQADFELLKYFIITGSLPWWVANINDIKIDEILKRVTKEDKNQFFELLKEVAADKTSVLRIISQFSASSVNSINVLLIDSHPSLKYLYDFASDIFSTELKKVIDKTTFENIVFESLVCRLASLDYMEIESVYFVSDFIERLLTEGILLNVQILKGLIKKSTTRKSFKILVANPEIDKLINDYFPAQTKILPSSFEKFINKLYEVNNQKILEEKTHIASEQSPNQLSKKFHEEVNKQIKSTTEKNKKLTGSGEAISEKSNIEKTWKTDSVKSPKNITTETSEKFPVVATRGREKTDGLKELEKTITDMENKTKKIFSGKEISAEYDKRILQKEKRKIEKDFQVDKKISNSTGEKSPGEPERHSKLHEDITSVKSKMISSISSNDKDKHEPQLKHEFTRANRIELLSKEEKKIISEHELIRRETTEFHIDNSGLVLIAVFLPAFFKNLGLLKDNQFKNKKSAERGVHLLQFIAEEREKSPEYVLTLNKILCGLDIFYPVNKSIKLTKKEKKEANDLVGSVIKNWSALKNISVKGFRDSFLIRKGIFTIEERQYNLKVERKSYDMLLERLPWSISIIKHNWMNKPVYVEW